MPNNSSQNIFQIFCAPVAICFHFVILSKLCQEYIVALPELFQLLSHLILLLLAAELCRPLMLAISGIFAEIPLLKYSGEVFLACFFWLGLWIGGMLAIPFLGYLVYLVLKLCALPVIVAFLVGVGTAFLAYQFFLDYLQEKRNYFLNVRK